MPPVAPKEALRRMTHASVGLLALLLRWLPWPVVPICCFAGIAMNFFVLPRVAPQIFRPEEGKFSGVRAYPMAVLLLVLIFPARIAAGAWGILALGDSMAALVGRTMGRHKLPWNRDKSWQGLSAFVCFGTCAGAIAYNFVEPRSPRSFGFLGEIYLALGETPWLVNLNFHQYFWGIVGESRPLDYTIHATSGGLGNMTIWTAAFAAASAAAIAESIRVKLDDNFRTALVAGTVFLYFDPLVRVIAAGF